MATTMIVITTVVSQPPQRKAEGRTRTPMTRLCVAMTMVTTRIGTDNTPLTTALQYRALIGSMGLKWMATPISVEAAMRP